MKLGRGSGRSERRASNGGGGGRVFDLQNVHGIDSRHTARNIIDFMTSEPLTISLFLRP